MAHRRGNLVPAAHLKAQFAWGVDEITDVSKCGKEQGGNSVWRFAFKRPGALVHPNRRKAGLRTVVSRCVGYPAVIEKKVSPPENIR